ncbi:MAG: hypothetical protein AAF903_02745 [Pseudomonadota bacterium]
MSKRPPDDERRAAKRDLVEAFGGTITIVSFTISVFASSVWVSYSLGFASLAVLGVSRFLRFQDMQRHNKKDTDEPDDS